MVGREEGGEGASVSFVSLSDARPPLLSARFYHCTLGECREPPGRRKQTVSDAK